VGYLVIVVRQDGEIWNYALEPSASNPELCVPYPSDMTIEDLRPVDSHARMPGYLARVGRILLTIWCLSSVDDMWYLLSDYMSTLQIV
jgi:hypothetical protein